MKLIATFNITNTSTPTKIMNYIQYSKIEIDGVVQPSVTDTYTFDTTGEHTVKYTLMDDEFNLNSNCTMIPESSFVNINEMTSIIIPEGILIMGDGAFAHCSNITDIWLPNTLTTFGISDIGTVIDDCPLITTLNIPDNVTSIGTSAIYLKGLTTVTIGRSIMSIGEYAFGECTNLSNVTINATTPPTLGNDAFNSNAPGRKIYVPSESVAAYKAASGWSTYAADIEAIP